MRAEAILRAGRARADESPMNVPSILNAAVALSFVKLLLKIRGFGGTIAWLRHHVARIPTTRFVDVGTVKRIEHAVAMAGAFYPGRAQCLEQSLALYYLLRRRGVNAKYCQGIQPHPFEAHAWLEYDGQVINDVPEHAAQFTRLPDLLP